MRNFIQLGYLYFLFRINGRRDDKKTKYKKGTCDAAMRGIAVYQSQFDDSFFSTVASSCFRVCSFINHQSSRDRICTFASLVFSSLRNLAPVLQ